MKKSTITINPKTAWLMGVDPVATGVRLQNKRTEFSLTREGLSVLLEQAGESVSPQAIYKWEKGKSLPTLYHLVVLACLYNCSLDELVVTYQRSRESAERDQLVPPLQLQYLSDNRTNIQKKECSFFYLQECAKVYSLCLQTSGWWLTGFFYFRISSYLQSSS